MTCMYAQQDGATYGTGSATRYNGYCECEECEEDREEAELEEQARIQNASQDSRVIAALACLARAGS